MKIKLFFIMSLISVSTFGQISFGTEKVLIDKYQMPSLNSEAILADLDGDYAKDLILTSGEMGYGLITVCPNINGDFTATTIKLVLNKPDEYPQGVSAIDIDNDGLLDLIACNRIDNKINWFKNLGNFTFAPISILKLVPQRPSISVISDIDSDGLNDIVVSLSNDDSIVWLKNTGNGSFMDGQTVFPSNFYDVKKIIVRDLNNDGLPEVIYGDSSGYVYWAKNLGNGNFGTRTLLALANSGTSFDFEDLNNDDYPDYVSTSSIYMSKQLNQAGNSFGTAQQTSLSTSLRDSRFIDVDDDGITDFVGTTGTDITFLKRFSNGTFGNATTLINISGVSYFISEDINNDSSTDFITPIYASTNTEKRLLSFVKNSSTNQYDEKIISYFNSAVFTVKIADLDNDGNNDIISAFRSVVWNKNKGNADFTSYKKISNHFNDIFTYDIEPTDIDNDNDIDIVTSTQTGIEIYYNDGNGNFIRGYNLTTNSASRNIEIADLNRDGFKDIVMTFQTSANENISLAWIPNINGISFGMLTTIGISVYGYQPYLLNCADMDNDGDIDIVTYSNEYSRMHLHTNNGNGIFTYAPIGDVFSAVCMAIEDVDNDGDKDIVAAGNYYSGVYLIKNNGGGIFANRLLIQNKKADALSFADLNGDGFKELVGTVTENSDLGSMHYYPNTGTEFGNQVLINSDTSFSLSRNFAMGDLNNDNMPDIVQSFYYIYKVSYFLNSSTLSIPDPDINDSLIIYPIPFTETLRWEIPGNNLETYHITIYSMDGKLVYVQNKGNIPSADLKSLPKGIYIFNLKSGKKSFSRKIIKN